VQFASALRTWMEEHAATHVAFLAYDRGEPVGMAWLAMVDRVPGPEHFTRRSAYVQSVYVVEERRDRGIGARLISLLLDHARRLGAEYVAVHPSDRAFPLYRRLGFSDSDRVLELRD
jgi:GNAT superfamily N-acetyltransferase